MINQAREAEPYLARFEDDWATGEIVRQFINGRRKTENVKAKKQVYRRQKGTTKTTVKHRRSEHGEGDDIDQEMRGMNGSGEDDADTNEGDNEEGDRDDDDINDWNLRAFSHSEDDDEEEEEEELFGGSDDSDGLVG